MTPPPTDAPAPPVVDAPIPPAPPGATTAAHDPGPISATIELTLGSVRLTAGGPRHDGRRRASQRHVQRRGPAGPPTRRASSWPTSSASGEPTGTSRSTVRSPRPRSPSSTDSRRGCRRVDRTTVAGGSCPRRRGVATEHRIPGRLRRRRPMPRRRLRHRVRRGWAAGTSARAHDAVITTVANVNGRRLHDGNRPTHLASTTSRSSSGISTARIRGRASAAADAIVGASAVGYDRLCTRHGRSCALPWCWVQVRLHVRGSAPDLRGTQSQQGSVRPARVQGSAHPTRTAARSPGLLSENRRVCSDLGS